jgi:peptidoglycan/LPS O-acetylase OafA/YrhL
MRRRVKMTAPVHPAGKTSAADKPTRHLEHLDAMRGIAILGVLWVHSALGSGISGDSPFGQISFLGQRGVQLFYMISAFTLFYTQDNGRPEHYPTSNFYLRRFFRIAPLYYCAILFNLLVNGTGGMRKVLFLLGFLFLNGASHTAINNVTPGSWSIAVESTFYILVPLLYARIRTLRQSLFAFCVAAAVFTSLSWALAYRSAPEYYTFFWFPVEFPVFLLGIVAYMAWKTSIFPFAGSPAYSILAHRRGPSALLLLLSAGLLLSNLNLHPVLHAVISWRNARLLPSSLMFLPLILSLSLYEWRALVNSFTRYLGRISYSMYLAHPFILEGIFWLVRHNHSALRISLVQYLRGNVLGAIALYICLTCACVPVCTLLWQFIEQPGIRLGRRTIARREHRVAGRAASLVPPLEELTRTGNTPDAQF